MITKRTNNFSSIDFSDGGIVLIDKPSGWTSFDVVNKIRHTLHIKKVGHAGTLDPNATGLLIIAFGKKTKELNQYQGLDKTYSGVIYLGKSTPSMDGETEFIDEKSIEGISEEQILKVRDSFLGESMQLPPMYSAVKHKGKKLYQLARKGKEVEREPRQIFVSDFQILQFKLPEIFFSVSVSKGTYIRVIADDFGKKLGCGAYLKELRRTRIGEYEVRDAFKIEDFVALVKERSLS
jgi:tRNA pseudouridine55 synthase